MKDMCPMLTNLVPLKKGQKTYFTDLYSCYTYGKGCGLLERYIYTPTLEPIWH